VVADTRAILSDLRRDQAGKLYAEAGQFFVADQLDAAKSAVRKALDLDPVHSGARKLRSEIEEALRRRDLASRAGLLMDQAEGGLRERRYEEAEGLLDSVRQLGLSDPQLKARVERAATQIEQARRCEKLLDAAREDLKKQNLTEAFRAVSEALLADPESNAGKELLQEIRGQMTSREARRRFQEDLSRVEGLLLIGETDQALNLLTEIGSRNPESAEASTLRARAEAQKAQEDRAQRLAEGTAEVRALLRNDQLDQVSERIDSLLNEFAGNPEIQALRRHVAQRLAAKRRMEQTSNVKSEAERLIEHGDFDGAIRALEAGIAEFGDDGHLTRMLHEALAGKAAQERRPSVSQVTEGTETPQRTGKLNAAIEPADSGLTAPGSQEGLQGAPTATLHEVLRGPRTLWIAGGVLAACGILFWALQPQSKPSPPTVRTSPETTDVLRIAPPTWADTVTLGQTFSQPLRAFGSPLPISWSIIQGSLPPGVALDSGTGVIGGKPASPGVFAFLAEASDTAGRSAKRAFTIVVVETPQVAGQKRQNPAKKLADSAKPVEPAAAAVGVAPPQPVSQQHKSPVRDVADNAGSVESAATAGDGAGTNGRGALYRDGMGVARDYTGEMERFQKAAAAGDVASMNSIGWFYQNGFGVTRDYAEAMKWFQKAAAGGNALAMYYTGSSYESGLGVTRDYGEAMKWFQKAAAAGHALGMYKIGWFYQNGFGVPRDYGEAMRWFQKAANAGNALSMTSIGWLYRSGFGVAQDYAEAMKWFQKAAAAGDTLGMTDIGWSYQGGLGVTRDYAEAMRWFRKAAAAGNTLAMYNIGALYEAGLGVQADREEALNWYRKAADAGNARAQESVRRLGAPDK